RHSILALRLARPHRGRRAVSGRVHGRLSQAVRTDELVMASLLQRAPRAIGSLIGLLFTTLRTIAANVWFWTESWLLDTKKSLYGLAVTRILIGLTGVGLLLTNFSSRLYTFGSGSAWNGELAEPVSDFPKIWLFSWFHMVAGNDALFT